MARNGAGIYALPESPFVFDTIIDEVKINSNNSDLASEMTNSVAADGQTTMTGALKMGAQKITGVAVGSAQDDGLTLRQAQAGAFTWCGTAGGTADAITLTPSPSIAAYADGQRFLWIAGASPNTGAMTIAVSALAAVAAQNDGAALLAGDHAAGKMYVGVYAGAQFQIFRMRIPGLLDDTTAKGARTTLGTSNHINIMTDYGATGDGITNDSAAIDAARTDGLTDGIPIYYPDRTFVYNANMLLSPLEHFVGAGRRRTFLKFTATGNAMEPLDSVTKRTTFVRFQDMTFQGDGVNPTVGLNMRSMGSCDFSHVDFRDFNTNQVLMFGNRTDAGGTDATHPGDSTYNRFYHVRFLAGQDALKLTGTAPATRLNGGTCNVNTFIGCEASSASRYNLHMDQGSANSFINFVTSASTDSNILLSWYSNQFIGGTVENSGAYGMLLDSNTTTYNNMILGLHNGGAHTTAFFLDSNEKSFLIGSDTGVVIPNLNSPSLAQIGGLYSDVNNNLVWKGKDSELHVSVRQTIQFNKTTSFSVVAADDRTLFTLNTGGGSITGTLAPATAVASGFEVDFHKQVAANTATIAPAGADLINGANASVAATADEAHITLVCDGISQWWIKSNIGPWA